MIDSKKILIVIIAAIFPIALSAQQDSVEKRVEKVIKNPVGTEFWLCFQRNYKETGNSSSDRLILELFLTADNDANVKVEIKDFRFKMDTLVPGGSVVNIKISPEAEITKGEEIVKKAVHITSDNPISVYGLNRRFQTTDTYLGLPVKVLGKEYRALCYGESAGLLSQIAIIALENNTKVTIAPSVNTNNYPKGIDHTIRLNRGQVYQILPKYQPFSECDLTGTHIKADKNIAVFSGHQCAYVPPDTVACNHLVEQLPPVSSWGRHFYLGKFKSRKRHTYRVLAHSPDTKLFINGKLRTTLQAGKFYEARENRDIQIATTKPSLVAQYSHGFSDGDMVGDPMMILVSPTQQFLKSYRFATPVNGAWHHIINVVAPNNEIGSLELNGSSIDEDEFTRLGQSRYSIASLEIPFGTHRLTCDEPFGMYSYGFGYKGVDRNDSYDAYGTMGGQSFIQYQVEDDFFPPTAEIVFLDSLYHLIIRDDRTDDKGLMNVRILKNYGVETDIPKIDDGAPQVVIPLAPIKEGEPSKIEFKAVDAALNQAEITVCYNFDQEQKSYAFYLTDSLHSCEVDPGLFIGAFGELTANYHSTDFINTGGLNAYGKFSEAFSFGGYGGFLISRQLQPNAVISARLSFLNSPAFLSSPDSSTSRRRDESNNGFQIFQEETTLDFSSLYLDADFLFEYYFKNQVYLLGGLNLSAKLFDNAIIKRRIASPDGLIYGSSGKREKTPANAPDELSSLRPINLGVLLGAGFNYEIDYRYAVFAETAYRYNFLDLIDDGDWNLHRFSLKLGFKYRILF